MGLALIALIIGAVIFHSNKQYQRDLDAKMEEVKQSALEGHKIVMYYYGLEKSGKLSSEQAQNEAKSVIAALRSGGDNYIWINTYEGVMVSHPNTDIIGKNLLDMKDSGGDLLFRRFTEIAQKDGAGYIKYFWPKPASTDPVEKISWVYGFEPWKWIIGTGVYLDAVHDNYIGDLREIIEFTAFISALFMASMLIFARAIFRSGSKVSAALQLLAEGEFYIDDHFLPVGNEFSKIWAAINIVRERLAAIERINIENKVSHINQQVECDKQSRKAVADFETTFVDTWDKVRGTLIGVRSSSASLNDRISETHQTVDTISQAIDGSSEVLSAVISSHDVCRLEIESRFSECGRLIENYGKTKGTLATSLELAGHLCSTVDDLQQALALLGNATSHVRLIDLVLNDIVMSEDKVTVRHDYQTLSAETKAILQRISGNVEALTARLDHHLSNAQILAHLRDAAQQAGAVDTATVLTNINATNDHIAALSRDLASAITTATNLANHARDIALSTARENADLVKISWQLGDAVSHMESLVVMVEGFMGTIRGSLRAPI